MNFSEFLFNNNNEKYIELSPKRLFLNMKNYLIQYSPNHCY